MTRVEGPSPIGLTAKIYRMPNILGRRNLRRLLNQTEEHDHSDVTRVMLKTFELSLIKEKVLWRKYKNYYVEGAFKGFSWFLTFYISCGTAVKGTNTPDDGNNDLSLIFIVLMGFF